MRTCKGQVDVELDWAVDGVETGAALSRYFLMTSLSFWSISVFTHLPEPSNPDEHGAFASPNVL